MTHYIEKIDGSIRGIPFVFGVITYDYTPGTYSRFAASDIDYHGEIYVEYDILEGDDTIREDVMQSLTEADDVEIANQIHEYFEECRKHDYI